MIYLSYVLSYFITLMIDRFNPFPVVPELKEPTMAIIRKKKFAEYQEVLVNDVDSLFCPSQYYIILVKGFDVGRPVDTKEKAEAIVDWFNSVDMTAFTEDLHSKDKE